jgi:hypothetical protein
MELILESRTFLLQLLDYCLNYCLGHLQILFTCKSDIKEVSNRKRS